MVHQVVSFIQNFTLSIAGEKLTKRLRFQSFQSILKQEIGWFDLKTNSTGHLTTRLATDAAEVKGVKRGLGSGLGLYILWLKTVKSNHKRNYYMIRSTVPFSEAVRLIYTKI